MISYGVISAFGAFIIAWFAQQIKRFHIMLAGTIFSSFLFITLLLWKPRHDDMAMFYVIAAGLGICDAIWQTQSSSKSNNMPICHEYLYSILFKLKLFLLPLLVQIEIYLIWQIYGLDIWMIKGNKHTIPNSYLSRITYLVMNKPILY